MGFKVWKIEFCEWATLDAFNICLKNYESGNVYVTCILPQLKKNPLMLIIMYPHSINLKCEGVAVDLNAFTGQLFGFHLFIAFIKQLLVVCVIMDTGDVRLKEAAVHADRGKTTR